MNSSGNRWRIIAVFSAILAGAVVAGMIASSLISSRQAKPTTPAPAPTQQIAPVPEKPSPDTSTSAPTVAPVPALPKPTMAQLASRLRRQIQFPEYIGKPAPELKAKDLDGKDVRLSDYRGRNVLIVFWAMWCGPCKEEIPTLVKLRSTMPEDKLAIIAVSTDRAADDPIANNTLMPELIAALKEFSSDYKINYTVVTLPNHMNQPYSAVNALPSNIFVAPDGTLKLATMGLLPPKDIEAIISAD